MSTEAHLWTVCRPWLPPSADSTYISTSLSLYHRLKPLQNPSFESDIRLIFNEHRQLDSRWGCWWHESSIHATLYRKHTVQRKLECWCRINACSCLFAAAGFPLHSEESHLMKPHQSSALIAADGNYESVPVQPSISSVVAEPAMSLRARDLKMGQSSFKDNTCLWSVGMTYLEVVYYFCLFFLNMRSMEPVPRCHM